MVRSPVSAVPAPRWDDRIDIRAEVLPHTTLQDLLGELERASGRDLAAWNRAKRVASRALDGFADGASPFNYFSPTLECLHGDPRFKADLRAWGLDV